ncbi:MAG: hypothetical protein JSV03_06830 [Planctomycetota bacterium]|nr:MAG: hypothetical protein JSV03_06830 [Planctomycetota bacterium]
MRKTKPKIGRVHFTRLHILCLLLVLVAIPQALRAETEQERWQRHQLAKKIRQQAQPYVKAGMADLHNYIRTEDPQINTIMDTFFEKALFGKIAEPLPPALPYRWLSQEGMYVGQWLWDTMFMVMTLAAVDDDQLIHEVFANYWHTIDNNPEAPKGSYRYGMVPNFLKKWPPVGFSQIPILAWGCRMVERQSDDRELIERALPYLVSFDKWHSTERDVDGDGLIEFGAYKNVKEIREVSLQQTARYEAFDLHPTTKTMKLTRHPRRDSGGAWYGNREGVELTCFVLMSERAIVEIARQLGKEELAKKYEKTIEQRIKALQEKMWDPQGRYFFTLDRDSDAQIHIRTIQGFFTMTCGAATPEQAAMLVEQLKDPELWWCKYPVPTVCMKDKTYKSDGYWGGDMWPATTYLVSLGLNRYGYHDLAHKLTRRMIDLYTRHGINERYDGSTGKPLGIPNLPMSCSIWGMILQSIYGIQEDFRTIIVPSEAKGRDLLCGKLQVKYPENNVVELKSAFQRTFNVVFPKTKGAIKAQISCDGKELAVDQVTINNNKITFIARPGKTYRVTQMR